MSSPEGAPRRPSSRPPRHVPLPRRRVAWMVSGGLALAALVGGGVVLMQKGAGDRLAREEAELAGAPLQSVEEIARLWRADPAGFDAQHKGNALGVEGVVDRAESVEGVSGSGMQRVVHLSGPDGLELACWFSTKEAEQVASWARGAHVKLVGRYLGEGMTRSELVLRGCRPR